ncbi:MAG: hypothetical protein WBF04_24545 [Candidatus Sulfotelmatobacter sp.]
MTIGIGVLCSSKPKPHVPRPDSIVMISDTMGSTDTDSTDDLHKMFIEEDVRLYAVCANRMEKCADLWPGICREFRGLPIRTHGAFQETLNRVVLGHRAQHFQFDILGPRHTIVPGQMPTMQHEAVMAEFQAYDSGAEMLIGTFDLNGQALLYHIGPLPNSFGFVHLCEFPGYMAIGAGAYNAITWLNHRRQVLGKSTRQSAYHAYEGKKMAERTPSVNDDIEMVIATPDGSFQLMRDQEVIVRGQESAERCPVSLAELEVLHEKYQAPKTDDLGHPKPSVSSRK